MAAFALGLLRNVSARGGLIAALADAEPIVQGRAAEALGVIGDKADAAAISTMVQAHVRAGALTGVAADDLTYPLPPQAEAVRLGLYALARLGSFEAVAAATLDPAGQPVSRWWPVAYALQRVGDTRAVPSLLALLQTEGRFTRAFAARGLGDRKAAAAVDPLLRVIEQRPDPAVTIQAVRALMAIGDARSASPLLALVIDANTDATLRLEALAALAALRPEESLDILLDLLSDPAPRLRAGAIAALARLDADTFLTALSGLDADRDWMVRAAQASALAILPAERALPPLTVMLEDHDQRVLPSVLNAMVALKAPDAERALLARLSADDIVVRATAASGLASLKSTNAVQPLIKANGDCCCEPSYVARAAALAALTAIDPAAARPILQEALKDRDWAVRVRALALLREGGMDMTGEDIRPAPAGRAIGDQEWQLLIEPRFSPHAYVETARGTIEFELAILDAPLTVASFIDLARRGFFNGVAIHRVVPDFVLQDGDPRGDGEGGPGYTIRDEINQRPYLRGIVGMALDWEDTGGSQFFITHSPQPHLDGRYTVFGHVVSGMDVVDRIQQGDVISTVRIWDGVSMTP